MKAIDKVAMKPILFSTPMVKAILDSKKTQTRRVIKDLLGVALDTIKHPYQPGQVLWVRETWTPFCINKKHCANALLSHSDYCFKASPESTIYGCCDDLLGRLGCKWRPSIHMPKKAARLFLWITGVRVERLQDITWKQALEEGIELDDACRYCPIEKQHRGVRNYGMGPVFCVDSGMCEKAQLHYEDDCVDRFADLWDSINAKRGFGWKDNPWVRVIEFKRIDGPDRQWLLDTFKEVV